MTGETPSSAGGGNSSPLAGKWRALLTASLALNLIVAGYAASRYWYQPKAGQSGRGAEEFGLQGFLRTLPKDRAKELRALIKDEKPDLKPLLDASRHARRTAADTLAAPNFEKDKLTAAFGAIDTAEATVKAAARAAVVAAASNMTADERKALADRWKSKRSKFFSGPNAPGHN